jgi:hypothetical protein
MLNAWRANLADDATGRRRPGDSMTAGLQRGMTTKQAAQHMNVPERSVYMARELIRTGHEDLCAEVEAGRMKISKALAIALPDKYGKRPDRVRALIGAWNRASESDRAAFLTDAGLQSS